MKRPRHLPEPLMLVLWAQPVLDPTSESSVACRAQLRAILRTMAFVFRRLPETEFGYPIKHNGTKLDPTRLNFGPNLARPTLLPALLHRSSSSPHRPPETAG